MKPWLAIAVFLATLFAISSIYAETMRLYIEGGAITDITDKDSGMLVLYLTSESQQDFAAFTGRHVGETVDILIDGDVLISPTIAETLDSSVLPLSASTSDAQSREMIGTLLTGENILEVRSRD